ncbi:MAG TPA: ATP synthase F1 subunit delta [Solirubrobacteraceae bacterium]|jgi:ATP synthase F1 delta subunit|nr:ATP synthase F1 subunit delta [Solirubrobacteraceae bacterium]
MEEIAIVYARSLFEVALEQGRLDTVREQLGQFADAVDQNHDLQVFFFSPYFSTQEKKDGLAATLKDADPAVTNFLELLLEKHRMPAIFRIRRQLDRLWEEENRLLPVQVTSATPLDKSTIAQIGDRISEQTGRNVELTAHVEPEILGGLVVQVGNSILDASIANRLEQLRKQVARG